MILKKQQKKTIYLVVYLALALSLQDVKDLWLAERKSKIICMHLGRYFNLYLS